MTRDSRLISSIDELQALLEREFYIADRGLATSIYLALKLQRPLLLEGEAGVGKTEVAKVLASGLETDLIRLQCYEGLDVSHAVYEWNYARYLLELLADFQITIPELGTLRATTPPVVIITSNRTRELHDALKRRCLYCWIDYPDFEKELRIVTTKVPRAPLRLAEQVTAFIQELRTTELYKAAGVSETLDWVAALVALDRQELDPATIDQTLGILLKNQEDILAVRGERVSDLLNRARAGREQRQQHAGGTDDQDVKGNGQVGR